jgi:hypothetical protein
MDWLGNAIILVIILIVVVLGVAAYYGRSVLGYFGAAEPLFVDPSAGPVELGPPPEVFEGGNVAPVDVTEYF